MKVLVVSPHPDDAEIALGGLISLQVAAKHCVTIAICAGEGDLTMVHSGDTISFDGSGLNLNYNSSHVVGASAIAASG